MEHQQVIQQQPIVPLTLPINQLKVSQTLDNRNSFQWAIAKLLKILKLKADRQQLETTVQALRRKPDGQTEHPGINLQGVCESRALRSFACSKAS